MVTCMQALLLKYAFLTNPVGLTFKLIFPKFMPIWGAFNVIYIHWVPNSVFNALLACFSIEQELRLQYMSEADAFG